MRILASIAAVSCAAVALAVPAKPTPMTFTQPDGTQITVQLRGDERSHFYLSEDGYLLVNINNAFYYGNVGADGQIEASAIMAKPVAKRTAADLQYLQQVDMDRVFPALKARAEAAPMRCITGNDRQVRHHAPSRSESDEPASPTWGVGLFPGTSFPCMGEQKGLVVLVQYTDKSFDQADPHDYWSRALNEPGFSDYGGTGSARDYWIDQSNGQFVPQFDVYGPITLSHNRSYYGGNDWWGNDQNPEQMAIEACQQLDATVDFSEYDRDNDGYIDNIFVIYAGQGEASYGGSDTVWPHSWDVSAATSTPYYFDGVRLDRYACSNDWESGRPDGIGTFVHEFSHVMGLPDLYATSYTGAFTPGGYSAMDYGPYNNGGCTPPNYGAYERNCFKWMQPLVLNHSQNVTLNPIMENEGCVIETSKSTEFFLLENRQKTGWDAYIPGHGMLIWHIDYNSSVWNQNTVNNTSGHQYVDIEEADNKRNEYDRDGDPFPGTANKTSFTSTTTPALKTWNATAIDMPITNIAEAGGIITFRAGNPPVDPPAAVVANEVSADDITMSSFVASWSASERATSYMVRVTDNAGNYLSGWKMRDVGNVTSIVVDGLEATTTYKYTVWAAIDDAVSDPSNTVTVATCAPGIDFYAMVAKEATEVTSESFVANWEGMDLATVYIVDVLKEEVAVDEWAETVDFADGIKELPEGWTTTTKFVYTRPEYCGEAAPALRMADASNITSPTFLQVYDITFWHIGVRTAEENSLVLKAMVDGEWQEVETYPAVCAGATEQVELPEGTTAVMLEYMEVTHKGSVAIDDIELNVLGEHLKRTPVEGYAAASAGNELSMLVAGLTPSTTYYYSVVGTDGTLMSQRSEQIKVTTSEPTGVESIVIEDAGEAVYYNMQGVRVAHPAAGQVYIKVQGGKATKVLGR